VAQAFALGFFSRMLSLPRLETLFTAMQMPTGVSNALGAAAEQLMKGQPITGEARDYIMSACEERSTRFTGEEISAYAVGSEFGELSAEYKQAAEYELQPIGIAELMRKKAVIQNVEEQDAKLTRADKSEERIRELVSLDASLSEKLVSVVTSLHRGHGPTSVFHEHFPDAYPHDKHRSKEVQAFAKFAVWVCAGLSLANEWPKQSPSGSVVLFGPDETVRPQYSVGGMSRPRVPKEALSKAQFKVLAAILDEPCCTSWSQFGRELSMDARSSYQKIKGKDQQLWELIQPPSSEGGPRIA
jgi:hypothetical protein